MDSVTSLFFNFFRFAEKIDNVTVYVFSYIIIKIKMILLLLIVSVYSITGIVGRYCENSPYISNYLNRVIGSTAECNSAYSQVQHVIKYPTFDILSKR